MILVFCYQGEKDIQDESGKHVCPERREGVQHDRRIYLQYDRERKNQEIMRNKEMGWRKYQTDNVGQREVIENICVRSDQNSLRETMNKTKRIGP